LPLHSGVRGLTHECVKPKIGNQGQDRRHHGGGDKVLVAENAQNGPSVSDGEIIEHGNGRDRECLKKGAARVVRRQFVVSPPAVAGCYNEETSNIETVRLRTLT
jgi:hypothetical protein